MPNVKSKTSSNALLQTIRSFVGKLRQSPDIYPIKYYKKGKQFRRHWHSPLIK